MNYTDLAWLLWLAVVVIFCRGVVDDMKQGKREQEKREQEKGDKQ